MPLKKKEEEYKFEIHTPESCKDDMLHDLEHGLPKGSTTYIKDMDQFWTWRTTEANIWTGYANEGKSLVIKQLGLIKVLEDGWNMTANSPEDMPAKSYYDDIIHTLSGQTTDKFNEYNKDLISKELYLHCLNLIDQKIKMLYIRPPFNTIENCLERFERIHQESPQKIYVMDPIMKFQKSKMAPDRIEDYMVYVVTLITDFARRTDSSVHLVIHQVTPKLLESGFYAKPNAYTLRGGGSGMDGIDNLLIVQRPFYAKDKISTDTVVGSQKIKKQKLTGMPGDFPMLFNRKTNRYTDISGKDLYNFDKWLK